MTDQPEVDPLACPTCKTRENLVISGIDVLAVLGRYEVDNESRWAVKCWGCGARFRINGATRDDLFGTAWRAS
jgi:hypothetical protein